MFEIYKDPFNENKYLQNSYFNSSLHSNIDNMDIGKIKEAIENTIKCEIEKLPNHKLVYFSNNMKILDQSKLDYSFH